MKGVRIHNAEQKKTEILRLFALGEKIGDICNLVGISYYTLVSWKKKDSGFKDFYEKIEAEKSKLILKVGVDKLAIGHEELVEETEWIDVDDEGRPVKKKRKVRKLPPNVTALKMLANKYDRTYNDTDNAENNITIRITQRDRSLSLEERLRLLESDASGVISVDSEDVVDVTPPVEGFE